MAQWMRRRSFLQVLVAAAAGKPPKRPATGVFTDTFYDLF